MTCESNADGKLSEKKMEEEDSLRTVECLRGRLLAERVASRNAKEEAEIKGTKLIELEYKLREETKSRNKAEKKLKFLIKKLESKNISYYSDESENSSFLKSEISSLTSTACSSAKQSEDRDCQESVGSTKSSYENLNCSELIQKRKSEEKSINLEKDGSQMSISIQDIENLSAKEHSAKSSEFEFSKTDPNSLKSSVEEENKNGRNEVDFQEDNVDNSLALVPMDLPKTKQTIDPVVLDATVREVLDALRHAKEKLQTQMQRGKMIKAS
ncbi:uncharacterized protein LOC107763610 [Nicotiana tabacum]|uniref:Uncharacterized protein LOC107763610 n=1 Tax=Nicotiana tabacum TaxID=4097 RepID=A0A1S3XCC2_TOBAC|nr:PREDICTED: uncharacterized protein LOC107763610 [Nicotiana tabacum]